MRAVAHGWKPSRIKGPTRAVAKEFVDADKRRDKVTGYQFGGPAMGPAMRGAGRMMQQYRGVPPQRGALTQGAPGGLHPGARGPGGGGFLSRFRQQRGQQPGQPLHPGAQGPGGGGFMSRLRQMMEQQRGQQPGPVGNPGGPSPPYMPPGGGGGVGLDPYSEGELRRRGPRGPLAPGGGGGPLQLPRGGPGGPGWIDENPIMNQETGQRLYGGRPTPGLHDRQDFSMGEGPGGRLEQEGLRRQAKMRGPGRFPGAGGPRGIMNQAQNRFGALTQGAPGGGSFGKRGPGRRIAPPPGKFPGGGNPMTRGRNPMMRGAGRFGGRGGRGGRGMFR